jgi:enoyl-CoA hydratase/carnithine racemase
MAKDFSIEREALDGGVTRLTLSRAPVNALSAGFLDAFGDTVDDLVADETCRAILITSPFKVLSAGLDLKEARDFHLDQQQDIVRALNVNFLKLYACPKPTVVAANGAAIAGGFFFVLASDFRLAAPKALFGLAEVRVGADFPAGPLEIARATLAPDSLRRLMLTGQPISAALAQQAGIIDVVIELDELESAARAEAARMADLPPGTFAKIKRQIRGGTIDMLEAAMATGANAPEAGWFNSETRDAMTRMIG